MLRDRAAAAAIAIVVAAGCSFQVSATGDAGGTGDDAAMLPTVGFAQAMSTQDENSGAVMVAVQLSAPAPGPVTVAYSFGGDAIEGTDYTATAGTLTFATGETTKAIDLTINQDAEVENDELIVIALDAPTGATLGSATHTITISASALPRITLSTPTSSADEAATVMFVVQLDAAAVGSVTVDYTVGGGTAQATGTYADFTLAAGTVTFPQGSLTQALPLGVINDTRNELAEDLTVTLTTSTGGVIGTTSAQTHSITDNDPVPAVRFAQATSQTPEGDTGTTQVSLNVTLSAASGRTVTVPFAVDLMTSTATDPGDYSLTGSSITFAEGVTGQTITVNVVGDTVNEPTEDLFLALSAPADGSAVLGAQSTRRLTINDNDPWCHGSGAYRLCYPQEPTLAVTLGATIDTDGGAPCEAAQPTGWTGQGQPTVCVVRGTTITQSGTTTVTGSRPLVLAATTSISIATLDVSSRRGDSNLGPASPSASAQCSGFLQVPGLGAGGAGGSFMSIGGDGGIGNGGSFAGRAANQLGTPPTALRGGCHGQLGGNGDETGKGGGAVYLVTGGTLSISGGINASGSSATGGTTRSGGSGAGSGGMIVLFAASISANTAEVIANGGGGASGGDNNTNGNNGSDPTLAAPTTPAAGGPSGGAGGAGGAGFAGGIQATAGAGTGNPNDGGGGGGGGGGYVKSNLVLTGATVSAGRFDVP